MVFTGTSVSGIILETAMTQSGLTGNCGRLVQELKRNLGDRYVCDRLIGIFEPILSQKHNSRRKIYFIHEPDVLCIGKGKEHRKYELGNKASVICSATGMILGAMSFCNDYDGHTIIPALNRRSV